MRTQRCERSLFSKSFPRSAWLCHNLGEQKCCLLLNFMISKCCHCDKSTATDKGYIWYPLVGEIRMKQRHSTDNNINGQRRRRWRQWALTVQTLKLIHKNEPSYMHNSWFETEMVDYLPAASTATTTILIFAAAAAERTVLYIASCCTH